MPLLEEISQAVQAWQQQVAEFAAQDPQRSRQLSTSEGLAQQRGQRVAHLALSSLLTEGGKGYHGTQLICGGGGRWRYQRDAARRVRTLVGEVRYQRAYYYCRACGASRAPKDEALGQGAREISAGVERVVGLVSAPLPFETGAGIWREVGGVELSGGQVETVAEAIGAEAEQRTQAEARPAQGQELAPALRVVSDGRTPTPPRVWVVEMDGIQAPLQDGSWQEVKCGVVYQLAHRVEVSRGRWELLRRERCVARAPVEEFREGLWASLRRAGVRVGEQVVVLGAGVSCLRISDIQMCESVNRSWCSALGRSGLIRRWKNCLSGRRGRWIFTTSPSGSGRWPACGMGKGAPQRLSGYRRNWINSRRARSRRSVARSSC